MSIGLALIFGVMRVVNFAQGDFMMLGMYMTYFLTTAYGIDPLLGAVVIVPPFFLVGVAVHSVILARVTGGGCPLQLLDMQLILTFGLTLYSYAGTHSHIMPVTR